MENKKVKIISSKKFYRQIYNKACNSFWELRPIFLWSFILGIVLLVLLCAAGFSGENLIGENLIGREPFNWKRAILVICISAILCGPTCLALIKNSITKKRSAKYIEYLTVTKRTRKLGNEQIDELLKDTNNLKNKYEMERNRIGKIFFAICKWTIFPITALIFKGSSEDLYTLGVLIMSILTILIPLSIAAWFDFQSFENLDKSVIRNYYLITVVEKELKYMKTIELEEDQQKKRPAKKRPPKKRPTKKSPTKKRPPKKSPTKKRPTKKRPPTIRPLLI